MPTLDELLQALGVEPGARQIPSPAGGQLYVGHPPLDTEGSQSFSVPNGTNLDQRLSFVAGSVIVDNNTSSYINIPDATKDGTGRWVPPGFGAAIPILGHISRARVFWTAPPGKTQPVGQVGETAQVVFAAAPVAPGFGVASPSSQSLPWITPNRIAASVSLTIANGANTVIVQGVTGQLLYAFAVYMTFDAAPGVPGVSLQTTNPITSLINYGIQVGPHYHDLHGGSSGVQGDGLRLLNGSAGSINARGSVSYSLA